MNNQVREFTPFYKTKVFIVFTQGVVFLLLLAFHGADFVGLFFQKPENLIYPFCVLILIQYVWIIWSWRKLTNNNVDLYVIFITSAFLFNAGHAFLEVFHLNTEGILNGRFPPDVTFDTLYLTITCLVALHFGAILSTNSPKTVQNQPTTNKSFPKPNDIMVIGVVLLAVSGIFTLQELIQRLQVVAASGYSALYQGEAATGLANASGILAGFFIPGCLFLLAGSKNREIVVFVLTLFALTYIMIYFISGQRGWNLLFLAGYAWLFHKTIRPIPRLVFVMGLIILVLVLPIIAVIRNIPTQERPNIGLLIQEQMTTANPIVELIGETGYSMSTTSYMLQFVPEEKDFQQGMTYVYSISTIIPNLGKGVHPSVANANLDKWLTRRVDPYIFRSGGGLGFSFIAEAYVNFGWLGASIFMAVIGFFLAKFTLAPTLKGDNARLALVACVISYLPFMARAQALNVVRGLVWYSYLPYLGTLLLSNITKKLNRQIIR